MLRATLFTSRVPTFLVAIAASLQACYGQEDRAEHRASGAEGSVYQWSAEAAPAATKDALPRPTAFLWIPPDCDRVRGIVVGQNNMLEQPVLEHPDFRAALAEIGFAAVWITPMIGNGFGPEEQRCLDELVQSLATQSGYAELATAPVVPIGHSALAEWPYRVAAARPGRTILAISLKGSWPDLKRTDAGWSGEQVAGVPLLFISGEYEWADERAGKCLPFRRQFPAVPFAMLADAGGGHFDVHDPLVRFLGDTIRRAARARLPAAPSPAGITPALWPIDATKEGWLVDRWRQDRSPRHPAAPVAEYAGDRGETFWCFDEEQARAIEAMQAKCAGKKPQLAGYLQSGTTVEQDRNTHQQVTLQWLPDPAGDGLAFTLAGTFLDTVPEGRPERWTAKKAGTPIDHATGGGPVVIRPICGPVERHGPETFAIAFDRLGFRHPQKSGEIWLLAEHPGDGAFKRCVQQSLLRIPVRNTNGPAQTITFPVIPDQAVGTGDTAASIPLLATSSAGDTARVRYHVHAGPAAVADDGTSLRLTALPPRARFPVKVTVVAWQWGRTIAPHLQSAEPMIRQFLVHENRDALKKAARSATATSARAREKPFVHPGLLHDQADLERMKRHVAAKESPWIDGFAALKKHPASSATWKIRGPLAAARFDADDRGRSNRLTFDADAAYQNALMWCVTGDEANARKAADILDVWASTLRMVDGHDARLRVALAGFKLISAAELLRHTYPQWGGESVARFEAFIRGVIIPQIRDFATFANGNWDAACLLTVMAAGIFLDDHDLFDRAVEHFRAGDGNGRLTHYIINAAGQCQESGRDQQHTQLGLGLLSEACEIAWHQGVDLYAEADNRLLAGFEYTARYNLGEDVPFTPHLDTTGNYRHSTISAEGRGGLRPIYELPWSHYGGRRGLPAPFTRQAAEKNRPEAAGVPGDHPGFGTLFFTRD